MNNENSRKFYDKEASVYNRKRWLTRAGQHIKEIQYEILLAILPKENDLKILELAPGTGRFTSILLKKSSILTALDVSQPMLSELKNNIFKEVGAEKIKILLGDARNTDLLSGSFDLIACFNAFSHIPEHKKVIKEAARLLKPKGIFLFNVPNYISPYFIFGAYVNLRKKSVTRHVYTKWYSFNSIDKDLKMFGFKVIDIKGHFHVPTWTPLFLLPFAKSIDRWFRERNRALFAPLVFIKAEKI